MDFKAEPSIKIEVSSEIVLNHEVIIKEEPIEEEKFACNLCNIECLNRSSLRYHKAAHHGAKQYKCDRCEYSSRFKDKFTNHVSTHDEPSDSLRCDLCSKIFRHKRSFRTHLKMQHGDLKYSCDQCEYTTFALRSFRTHRTKHDKAKPASEFSHQCQHCGYSTEEERYLHIHLRNRHNDVDEAVDGFYNCKMCPEKYKEIDRLSEHLIEHKIYTCDTCSNYSSTLSKLKAHKNTHAKLACKFCDFEAKSYDDLTSHKCGNRVYCHLCSHSASRNSFLVVHILRVHNVKTFICGECSESFAIENLLTEHVKKFHKKSDYQCEYCLRYLTGLSKLKKHRSVCSVVNVEARQQRRKCHLCNYSNIRDEFLIVHINKNHEGVKNFPCQQCDLAFHTEHTLFKHAKAYHVVTKFRCHICRKYFRNANFLKRHAEACKQQPEIDVK